MGHEEYTFPTSVELIVREQEQSRRLSLTVTAEPNDAPDDKEHYRWNQYATRVNLRAEANLGRNLRFAPPAPAIEEEP
jgi:hypothetical protein